MLQTSEVSAGPLLGFATANFTTSLFCWTLILSSCAILLSSVCHTIWLTVAFFNIVAFYCTVFVELYIILIVLAVGTGRYTGGLEPPETKRQQNADSIKTHRRISENMNKASVIHIELSSDSDSTLMGDSQTPQHIEHVDISDDEGNIPELEKTAENGWIQILMTPRGPYDYDNDPAGLYGGREVDNRPSLIEFYHQDARTNGFFARMAPTKAERVAAAKAKLAQSLPESDVEEISKHTSKLSSQPTSRANPPGAQRSYAEALMGAASKSMPAVKKAVQLPPNPREKSAKQHALELVDVWTNAEKAKAKHKKDPDLQKAIDASLALSEVQKADLEFDRAIDISKAIKEKEDSDLQQAITASKTLEEIDLSDSPKRKRSGSCSSVSDGSDEESDSRKTLRFV